MERRTGSVATTMATYGTATAMLLLLAPVGTWPVACAGALTFGVVVDLALWRRAQHRLVVTVLQTLGVVGATMTTSGLLAVEIPGVVGSQCSPVAWAAGSCDPVSG